MALQIRLIFLPLLLLLPLLAQCRTTRHDTPSRALRPHTSRTELSRMQASLRNSNSSSSTAQCAARSLSANLEFNVTGFTFHSSRMSVAPSRDDDDDKWARVSFSLGNTASDYYSYRCAAEGDDGGASFADVECEEQQRQEGEGEGEGEGEVDGMRLEGAVFSYDGASGDLFVAQRWACEDQKPWELVMNVSATVNASVVGLQCLETKWQNPDWKDGEVFADDYVDCDSVDVLFRPTVIEAWW